MGTTETSILLKLVVAPLGVALLGWLFSYAIKHKTAWSAWLLAIFIAGAVGLSDQLLRGSTDWWPVDVTRRLPWFVLGAALLAGLTYLSGLGWKSLNIIGRLALSAFVSWQMTVLAEPRWWWLAGTTALLFVSWMALSYPLPLAYSWLVIGTWAAIAGITGGVLVLSGSASLGLVSVALGVALGAVALLQIRWRHPAWQAVAGLFTVALFTLVLSGQQFAELPIRSGLLLLAAPWTVLLLHSHWLIKRPALTAITVLVCALLLTGGAAWLAKPVVVEKPAGETSNPYADYYRK
jgi:hypothetical protein